MENSLIKDIGRSYIVSSFIPAALFLAVAVVIFKDFAPAFFLRRIIQSDQLYTGQLIIFILLTAWLGFALYSGWNTTARLFEGYYFPNFLKRILVDKIKRVYSSKSEIIDEYNRLMALDGHTLTPTQVDRLNAIEPAVFRLFQDLEMNFPVNGEPLPTRLGNILRASERYPFDRYRIEAITIFPRLVHLFPPEFANQLEESNNKYIFLLNSSLLVFMIGIGQILVSVLRVPCYLFNDDLMRNGLFSGYGQYVCSYGHAPLNFFQAGFQHLNEWKYFFLGIGFVGFGYLLYRIAAITARAYSNLIRSGYDLYRYELFDKLHIPLTNDFKVEKDNWLNLSRFFNNGENLSPWPIVPDFKPKGEEFSNEDTLTKKE